MRTLPKLANEWNVGLDALRACVRGDPKLQRLGTVIGPTRCFTPEEVEAIRIAFAAREARRFKKRGAEPCPQ